DVRALLGDREAIVQVKTALHGSPTTTFTLGPADLTGITSGLRRDGYIAYLDCAEPVNWSLIRYERARLMLGKPLHVASLRAEREKLFSDECNVEFFEIVRAIASRNSGLTYQVLRKRALQGEYL